MKNYQIAVFVFCILLGCAMSGCRQGVADPSSRDAEQPGTGRGAAARPFEPSDALLSVAHKASPGSASNAQAKNSGDASETFVIMIAVEDYMRGEPLHFTRSDAIKVLDELIGYGIVVKDNVRFLTTGNVPSGNLATKDRIEEVIGEILGKAKEGDTIVIYMGGHGAEYNGVPYFCPLNSDGSQASKVSIGEIITAFGRSKATFKMMIVDACRNGETSGAFAALKVPQGVMLLQSCGSGETSIELLREKEIGGEVVNPGGLFTIALVEGLQGKAVDNSGNITLLSLAAWTMKRTPVLAANLIDDETKKPCKQTPHMQGNMTDIVLANAQAVRERQERIRREQEGQTPPPSPEEIAQAQKNVEDTVERLLQACLDKFADDNKNSLVNPYNDTSGLAFKIAQIIRDSFPNNDIDMKTAAHGKSEFGKEQLKKDVIDKPVQARVDAARKQWNEDLAERKAKAEKERQEAIAKQQEEEREQQAAREKALADFRNKDVEALKSDSRFQTEMSGGEAQLFILGDKSPVGNLTSREKKKAEDLLVARAIHELSLKGHRPPTDPAVAQKWEQVLRKLLRLDIANNDYSIVAVLAAKRSQSGSPADVDATLKVMRIALARGKCVDGIDFIHDNSIDSKSVSVFLAETFVDVKGNGNATDSMVSRAMSWIKNDDNYVVVTQDEQSDFDKYDRKIAQTPSRVMRKDDAKLDEAYIGREKFRNEFQKRPTPLKEHP